MRELWKNSDFCSSVAAISATEDSITYKDLSFFSDIFAQKVKQRSLIFHLCRNTVGSLAGYLGCLRNRVVPLMLDAGIERGLLAGLLAIYRPNYLWVPASQYDNDLGTKIFEQYDYVLVEHCKEPVALSDNLALLLTTSGSTGSPKLVRLSYNNIQSNAEAIADYLDITAEERPITSLPMSYSFGLSVINSHLLKGATILLTDGAVMQKEFWNFAKEQKATSLSGVPYTYEMLRRLRIFRMDLPTLKTFTQAGGKLSAALVKEYVEQATVAGKRFVVMYGQTEATARMSYLPFERALEKNSSIGIPIPGGRFALVDENGSIITEPDKDGELVYYGANVSLGYAESREDLAKGDENKGVLYTGDIARRDSDGFYTITGRKKRFVKVFGNRVNLDAVEQIVKTVISSCACVGVDDKITVFITEPDPNKYSEIKSLLSQKTGLNTRAFSVQHLDKIPKNASGKVQYSVLSEQI